MRFELTGHQLEIPPTLRRLVTSKIAKLGRLMDDVAVSAQVVLFSERTGARAEMSLHARGERFLHSSGTGDDLPEAVGDAIAKLVQQGKSVKGKWHERQRRPARVAGRSAPRKTASKGRGDRE